jgi:hypothetical protein
VDWRWRGYGGDREGCGTLERIEQVEAPGLKKATALSPSLIVLLVLVFVLVSTAIPWHNDPLPRSFLAIVMRALVISILV